MHTDAWEKRRAPWQSGGWSEHISTHDSTLGSFVSRQEGTRVGKKKENIRRPGDIGRVVRGRSWWWNACVCVYVCTWTDECVLSVSVYCVNVDHYSCFATLRILAWIRHKRQKASYLCLRVKDYLFHWMCPPIICLSLPALFNLFLVSAQWLPLTVSPSQM